MNGRALKIEGNPEHPLNRGKLCARGQAGLQLLYNPDRLASPVAQATRGSRAFKSVTWEEGLNTLFRQTPGRRRQSGGVGRFHHVRPSVYPAAAFTTAVGAPAPLIYDLFSGMNGYSALVKTNRALFGKGQLPAYDLSNADVVLSFGADLLGPAFSQVRYGVEFGNFRSQPKGQRGYLVELEPRMSLTGAKADLWLPIQPGSEALVAQAMVQIIADQGFGPPDRVAQGQTVRRQRRPERGRQPADLTVDQLTSLARIFAQASTRWRSRAGAVAGTRERRRR